MVLKDENVTMLHMCNYAFFGMKTRRETSEPKLKTQTTNNINSKFDELPHTF